MQNLLKLFIFILCCLIAFLLLCLFHAAQNSAGRLEIREVKTVQDSTSTTRILSGKSIIQ